MSAMICDRITVDPSQMEGVPCIRGLRIPVSTIAIMILARVSDAQILMMFPDLEPADLVAVHDWARKRLETP